MRIFRILLSISLCLFGTAALAADSGFSGAAVFSSSGDIMIEGHEVTLWGVDRLAGDQQCWHEDHAWDCGEQSVIALRHHVAGMPVRCALKTGAGGGKMVAQCFSKKGDKEEDVAHYLVIEGWARDKKDESGGLYAADQEFARAHRRGIWTSRFQSAEDWKNGVQSYVQYDMAPAKTVLSAHHPSDATNNPQ